MNLVDLGDGADVACDDGVDLRMVLALELEDVCDTHAAPAVIDVRLQVVADVTLVHAEDGELADERVGGDLEDMREERLG